MSSPTLSKSNDSIGIIGTGQKSFRQAVWLRFVLAVAIVAVSTIWALTTRTTGVESARRPIVHWKFWTHPLEWNPNARKPYLQGDLKALAVSQPPQGKAWVYFGGSDGFVVRRGLDDEEWEAIPLPKIVEARQDSSTPASATDASGNHPSASKSSVKK